VDDARHVFIFKLYQNNNFAASFSESLPVNFGGIIPTTWSLNKTARRLPTDGDMLRATAFSCLPLFLLCHGIGG
jgi:hypothetical protein